MLGSSVSIGFLLALGCALCWAVLDVCRKQLGRRMTATGAVAWLMSVQVVFILPALLMGLFGGIPALSPAYLLPWGGSVLLNLWANFLFLRSMQLSPLSLTTPYLAFTPVFTALTAFVAFQEAPGPWGLVGIATVCMGAFFMNPGTPEDGPLAPIKALWTERGSLYMLVVALLWSITPIMDKQAAALSSPLWHTMCLAGTVGALFMGARLWRDRGPAALLEEFGRTPVWLVLGSALAVGAMSLQLASYEHIGVAYVETVKRALGVTVAIVAGYVLFQEREIGRRLLGAVVMSLGVALILLAG